jgi:SAM-dependent methyltransferase
MRHSTRQSMDVIMSFHARRLRPWTALWKHSTTSELGYAVKDDSSFDFSSKLGWDQYYQKAPLEDTVKEWHVSIPLETIAALCPPCRNDCDVLMIGCGTSRLLDAVLDQHLLQGVNTRITSLDSSATCIDQLRSRYQDHPQKDNLFYVCGDAVHLSSSLSILDQTHSYSTRYDYIIDKGLMDALFCGDGWNGPVATLLSEASSLLKAGGVPGKYVLISYRLPKATKEYLLNVSVKAGLKWDFDCTGSSTRVSISVATKVVP